MTDYGPVSKIPRTPRTPSPRGRDLAESSDDVQMRVDDTFQGLAHRLQHFAIPASGFASDTFTATMLDVQHGRMALLEFQQSVSDRDRKIDTRISSMQSQYRSELAQAMAHVTAQYSITSARAAFERQAKRSIEAEHSDCHIA